MPRTGSALASAAGAAGHQPQKQQQQSKKPHVAPPAPCNGLGAGVPPTKTNGSTISNNNSTINISNSNLNSNAIVARAATPASPRARSSFDSVPMECLAFPSPCRQQGEPAADEHSSTSKTSESSSCAIIHAGVIDTEITDNHANVEDNPMDSSLVSIELAEVLDDASPSLQPLGEMFSPDRKQQQHYHHQQQYDLSPVPLIRGGSSGNPDTAFFDFDVDEVDTLIGELVEKHDQEEEHEQHLASENHRQRQCLQQPQEEEGEQQQQQQQEEKAEEGQQQQDDQQPRQQDEEQQQQDKVEVEERAEELEGQQGASSNATAAATFAAPLKAVLMDGPVAEALEGAMTLTQRKVASTKDTFARACNVALQNQAETVQAWQKVVTTVHTAAVLLREDNDRLMASNAVHELVKRGMVARITGLENRVSVLIAERDRLATKLKESGAGSPAETRGNGNSNSNNNNCRDNGNDNGCSSPDARGLGVSPGAPPSESTIKNRASAVAASTAAAVAASATAAALPALARGTATGQQNSIITTAPPAAAAAMSVMTMMPTMTMTMAPQQQQGETGLVIPTAPPSVNPSAVVPSFATMASTAEPAAQTTENDKTRPLKVFTPAASTTATSITAPTPHATATATATTSTEKPTRRGGKVGDVVIEGRATWVGGRARNAVFPSPSAAGNRVQAMSALASSSAERGGSTAARRAAAATRSPLSVVSINTKRSAVPAAAAAAAAGKIRKAAAPCVDKSGRASSTRGVGIESTQAVGRPTGMVAVKRIVSDDRGATEGGRRKPEGVYEGRLRSASRPRKADTKVVAGGSQKVVSGTGVSSRSAQEAAANEGAAAGRRGKVAPKKRWV